MKLRLPLYARILLWFLLNVVILAGLFFGILQWQFQEGLHSALGGIAGDRLQVIGQQLHGTLSSHPRSEWTDLLHSMGQRHNAQVTLIAPPEKLIAGDSIILPEKVHTMLRDMRPERPPQGGNDDRFPPDRRPPPPRDRIEELLFGELPLEDSSPPPRENIDDRPATEMPIKMGTFMIRAGEPARYYTGIRLPPPTGWERREGPMMLIVATDSMTGNGLFLDLNPWLWAIFGAMAISALLWLPFVRGITHAVGESMRATESIAKGHFDVRVPEGRGDELGRLAHAVNQMAIQLDGLVRGQKRFLGDIAHELCSPVARMEMGLGILEQRLGDAHADRLQDVREELREMSALVNELLSFSKAAIGQADKPLELVKLLPLVDEVAYLEGVPQDLLEVDIPADLRVKSRGEALRRAISNILRNALLHAPGEAIRVTATRKDGMVHFCIVDHGPGVPEESLPRLFEPFYRVDVSRTRDTGGTGLGLSIVKNCVEASGGSVSAQNHQPHGLEVCMELQTA